jgi:streptomycin 6-kinase
VIPADFIEYAGREFGAAGTRWVHSLPSLVAELERWWSISTGGPIGEGRVSIVLAAHTVPGERDLALKLTFLGAENREEAAALRAWGGAGAVELIEADETRGALLLERLDPGWSLLGLDDDQVMPAACAVLRRLWRPAGPAFRSLDEVAARWAEELGGEVARLVSALAPSSPQPLLLHGDAHEGNFLAGSREPWLLIDPKPVLGDPAFDLAPLLRGRWRGPDTLDRMRHRLAILTEATGFDRERIRGWALAKTIAWFDDPPSEWEIAALERLRRL